MESKNNAGHLCALLTIIIWGTTFISTKVLLVDFQPVEILFFRFIMGLLVLLIIYPHHLTGTTRKQEFTFAAAPLWNLLILSFGEYRPYLYDGFKCRCYYFSCTILYGYFKPSVFERRRKVTGKFLYWFRCCNDRDIPD